MARYWNDVVGRDIEVGVVVTSSALRARSALRVSVALLAAALAGGVALSGCARPGAGAEVTGPPSSSTAVPPTGTPEPTATTRRPPSSTHLPTLKPPTGPPKTPTDDLPTDVVVGTVIAAKSPCFEVVDDEGRSYALYGTGTPAVAEGDTVRVKIAEQTLKIYCGPGQPARIVTLEVVG